MKTIDILLIDDDLRHRVLVRKMLEKLSYAVNLSEADEGGKALALLRQKKFDCILVDMILPDFPGIELYRKIRHEGIAVPAVFITSYLTAEMISEFEREGVKSYIAKDKLTGERLAVLIEGTLNSVAKEKREPACEKVSASHSVEGMRVLIVDDVLENVSVLKKILTESKLNISIAQDGETALRIADEAKIDLILLDIVMPGIDGFETCRRLKSNNKTKDIPVVFISSRTDAKTLEEGFAAGGVDYVAKPFYAEEVLARIKTQLLLSRALRENKEIIGNLNAQIDHRNRELLEANEKLKKSYDSLEAREHDASSGLEKSEESLKAALNSLVDSLIEIDAQGIVLRVNPATQTLFGYEPSEVLGKNVKMLMPEPYRSEHDRYLTNYLSMGKAKIIGIGREVVGLRKDGSAFPMDLAVSQVIYPHGKNFIGVCRDITDKKQVEADLIEAKDDAEKANKAKSEFLSRMSHELRTPMNAIIGFAQLLTLDPARKLDETQATSVGQILSAGKHLLNLINEVLDLAKVESGSIVPSLESVNLKELLQEVVELLQPIADKFEVVLIKEFQSGDDVFVLADRTRLKQVMMNLLSNGIKYNVKNGKVFIRVLKLDGSMVRIRIEDTGIGIPEEKRAQLFQPFTRLIKDEQTIEGTGIGLTISKHLVELMDGIIACESGADGNTIFYADFKAAEKSRAQAEEPPSFGVGGEVGRVGNERQFVLLYIEDNPTNLELVRQVLLSRKGIKFLSAPDARIGIDIALSMKPDLILMDINLPGIDGYEALKILRENENTRDTPVFAVSANALAGDIRDGMQAGFDAYISKPFNVLHFLDKIDGVVSRFFS